MMRKNVKIGLLIAIVTLIVVGAIFAFLSGKGEKPLIPLNEEEAVEIGKGYATHFRREVEEETIELISATLFPVEEFIEDNAIVTEDNVSVHVYIEFAQWPDKIWIIKFKCRGRVWSPYDGAYENISGFQLALNAYYGELLWEKSWS